MVTAAPADVPRVVTVLACVASVAIIVATVVSTVDALRTNRELRQGARALRGNFDGHQCAPPMPPHTEN